MTHRIIQTLAASALSALLLMGAGCDSGASSENITPPTTPAVVTPPTEVPPTTPAALSGSTTRPTEPFPSAPSYLFVKEVPDPRKSLGEQAASADGDSNDYGTRHEFPRARLKLSGKGGHNIVALLYSDDPPAALKTGWAGDRYYFRLPLQAVDRDALDGLPYRMSVPYEGGDETSNGIFLRGDQEHLEPIDLTVIFEREGTRTKLRIGGLFRASDANNPQAESKWYHVQGIIQAVAE